MIRIRSRLIVFAIIALSFAPNVFAAKPPTIDMPMVRLQALDKTTARTTVFTMKVGTTVQMGTLFIRASACRNADPLEEPESAAFIQMWEEPKPLQEPDWVFSGWMFSSSPALSAMDHPVYDVWVIECMDDAAVKADAKSGNPEN